MSDQESSARLVYKSHDRDALNDEGLLNLEGIFEEDTVRRVDEVLQYTAFSPVDELRNIRELSIDEERLSLPEQHDIIRERIKLYRQRLTEQRKGIATILQDINDSIQASSDIESAILWAKVAESAATNRLSKRQLEAFDRALTEYEHKHFAVTYYRREYPNDAELYAACIGTMPHGKVDVIVGPMMLAFRCWDERDYAQIYTGSQDEEAIIQASLTKGATLAMSKVPQLDGVIIGENGPRLLQTAHRIEVTQDASGNAPLEIADKVLIHEQQHLINKLFIPIEQRNDEASFIAGILEKGLPVKQALRLIVQSLVRQERQYLGIDAAARDEILAFYSDGTSSSDIYYSLTEKAVYDYRGRLNERLKDLPDYLQEGLAEDIEILESNYSRSEITIERSVVEEAVDVVFDEEYKRDLARWTGVLTSLETKGYSRQEVLHLLYQEPVYNWTTVARQANNRK